MARTNNKLNPHITPEAAFGSMYVSGKLTTYLSPNLTLTLTSHFGQNVGLGEV